MGSDTARLVTPQAAFAFDFVGGDSHAFEIPPPPTFASARQAAEMVEVYWQALTRDVPFIEFAANATTLAAATDLSRLSRFDGPKHTGLVTTETIFRGSSIGDLDGPYLSQFLWKDVPQGPYGQAQRVREAAIGRDYLTDYASWLDNQNGFPSEAKAYNGSTRRYIATGRDLTEFLHRDYTFQAYLNAALILLQAGAAVLSGTNPYRAITNQTGFSSFGAAHILDCVAAVANLALRATWYQKWCIHRRLRPEAFGGRVHNSVVYGRVYPIHADLLNSDALARVLSTYGTCLLPQAYPEGAPLHPAYPAGHAAMAGACATVLKAFFNEDATLRDPVQSDAVGSTLIPYVGAALTVGGELNKLASNISLGRDTAGVHWRTDAIAGMNLGEQVAIRFLLDLRRSPSEPTEGFVFKRFDGTVTNVQ